MVIFLFTGTPKSDLADLPKNTKLDLGELCISIKWGLGKLCKSRKPFIQLTITRLNDISSLG